MSDACLKCFNLGHATSKCPEKVRSCSKCRVTHGPQLLCRTEIMKERLKHNVPKARAKEKSTSDEEKKHCIRCFESGFPADHEGSDDDYHIKNLEIVDPCHEGVSCNRCGEQDILGIRWNCTTCQNYSLCADCEEFSRENDVTFISVEGKRHGPNHNLESSDVPGEPKVVLRIDVVARNKSCPRCLQETCTSRDGSAPCEDKDMERPSSRLET